MKTFNQGQLGYQTATYDFNRLVLGTAQLGMSYGIANKTGQPDLAQAMEIVQAAWQIGIRRIDTAQGYGNSESVIGKALQQFSPGAQAEVITKLDTKIDLFNKKKVIDAVRKSIEFLQVPNLYGLMLHREGLLNFWDQGIKETFLELIQRGLLRYAGISVYSPDQAHQALEKEKIDFVQIPSNIFDRRFFQKEIFKLAAAKNKQLYVRSIFLQGLILMNVDSIPDELAGIRPFIQQMDTLGQRFRLSRLDMALGYVRDLLPHCFIVFGVESVEQLRDIVSSWLQPLPKGFLEAVVNEWSVCNEHLLDPSQWFSPQV